MILSWRITSRCYLHAKSKRPINPTQTIIGKRLFGYHGISLMKTAYFSDEIHKDRLSELAAKIVKTPEMIECEKIFHALMLKVRAKDFTESYELYNQIKQFPFQNEKRVNEAMLSVCFKKDHLEFAQEMFNGMVKRKVAPTESAYLALIRCYSDNFQIEEAFAIIKQMNIIGIEIKLRTYHPILEALCQSNRTFEALELLHHMKDISIYPRTEQIALILAAAKRSQSFENKEFVTRLNEILFACSTEVVGVSYMELLKLGQIMKDDSNTTFDSTVLINTMQTITGTILSEETPTSSTSLPTNVKSRRILAMNAYLQETPLATSNEISSKKRLFQHSSGYEVPIKWQPELYELLITPSSSTSLLPLPLSVSSSNEQHPSPHLNGNHHRSSCSTPAATARVVDIANEDCSCPNCGAKLNLFLPTEEQRQQTRVSLMKTVSLSSLPNARNLQTFSDWIDKQEEIDYIIDGANVAYNRQNFAEGKFSYKQIEMIVKKLLEERKSGKILVLLPYAYTQNVIPNSVRCNNRSVSHLSTDDLRILNWLQQEVLLYVVPQGADDDWYWMFATMTANRTKPAYVITNDQIRDHRVVFQENRTYIRWKSSHVIHFDAQRILGDEIQCDDDLYAKLIYPDLFSREMQLSDNGFWHIPAIDRRVWLCMNTAAAENSNTA
eukprot:gene2215-4303_t